MCMPIQIPDVMMIESSAFSRVRVVANVFPTCPGEDGDVCSRAMPSTRGRTPSRARNQCKVRVGW